MALTFAKKAAGAATSATTTRRSDSAEQAQANKPTRRRHVLHETRRSRQGRSRRKKTKRKSAGPQRNRLRRFKLGYNEDCQITFLDGKLDEDGDLDIPRYYEHTIQVGGDWETLRLHGGDRPVAALPDLREHGDKPRARGRHDRDRPLVVHGEEGSERRQGLQEPAQAVRRQGDHAQDAEQARGQARAQWPRRLHLRRLARPGEQERPARRRRRSTS